MDLSTAHLKVNLYLSRDVRQLRGGREERQLWERLREAREARASPGQKVDRSRKVTPCPLTWSEMCVSFECQSWVR